MNKIEKQILDDYIRDYTISNISYQVMGRILDEKFLENRLEMLGINEVYIYGGSYMAVQFYQIGKKYITIKNVVDKFGKIAISGQIPVITLDELRIRYNGEKIIVASIRYFQEIKEELELFVNSKDIICIEELLMGMILID